MNTIKANRKRNIAIFGIMKHATIKKINIIIVNIIQMLAINLSAFFISSIKHHLENVFFTLYHFYPSCPMLIYIKTLSKSNTILIVLLFLLSWIIKQSLIL